MKKITILFTLFIFSTYAAATDYTQMSTQELIAIMGFVKPYDKEKFLKELGERVPIMTPEEKREYEKNMKKLKPKK